MVETVSEEIDQKQAKKAVNKMMSGQFDLNDMLAQLEQINKLSMNKILKMIPGMPKISDEDQEKAQKELNKTKAIINSMTPEERAHPEILKNSRKLRIAAGSGTSSMEINRLLKKFEEMKKMMKQMPSMMKSGKMPGGPGPGFGPRF